MRFIEKLITKILSQKNKEVLNSLHLMAHPLVKGMPKVRIVFHKAIDNPERLPIAQRLIKAYSLAIEDEGTAKLQLPQNDLWTHLIDTELKELLHILKSKDINALSNYLLHFGEQFTWFGDSHCPLMDLTWKEIHLR